MRPAAPVPHATHHSQARRLGRVGRALESAGALAVVPLLAAVAVVARLMATAQVIGTEVTIGTRPGPSSREIVPGGTYLVIGQAERGRTDRLEELLSMQDYADRLGGRVAYGYLFDDLETFFAEGGTRALVARIVGPAATIGLLALVDRSGGAGLSTVTLSANSPGAWSSTVTIEVVDGALTNTFSVFVRVAGDVVEQYLEQPDPATFVANVNNSSSYLTAANNASVTAAPANNPRAIAATALSAGSDDRASIVAAHYTAALSRFGTQVGGGTVAIPNMSAGNVGAAIALHCRTFRRIGILAPATSLTVAQVKTVANTARTNPGSEWTGIFYPWIKVTDGAGGNRTISPEGYIAALRSRAAREVGPHRAPIGNLALSRGHVLDLASDVAPSDVQDLAAARVNSIIKVAAGVRNNGWRSLSTDATNWKMLTAAAVSAAIGEFVENTLDRQYGESIDDEGRFFSRVEGEIAGYLTDLRAAGALYALWNADHTARLDPGFTVDTGPTVNTPAQLADNVAAVDVAFRVAPTAELLKSRITKVAFATSL